MTDSRRPDWLDWKMTSDTCLDILHVMNGGPKFTSDRSLEPRPESIGEVHFDRRPRVRESEFSLMQYHNREVDATDPLILKFPDLVYKSKDGKYYFPNFMVDFLLNEYTKRWSPTYQNWAGRGHIKSLTSILVLDTENPLETKQGGLVYTTVKRMRDEYRREQIRRMKPDERKRALEEDARVGTNNG